jgi:hypothetical protein
MRKDEEIMEEDNNNKSHYHVTKNHNRDFEKFYNLKEDQQKIKKSMTQYQTD